MISCWNTDAKKRSSIKKIRNTLGSWSFRNKHNDVFDQAEVKRMELINSKKLGPEFSKKPHPKAIYTSRPLSSFISNISKCSSINSSSFNNNKKLISADWKRLHTAKNPSNIIKISHVIFSIGGY